MSEITKRFSDGARRVITAALLAAKEMGHSYVGSEHLLLGILREDCMAARLLKERGADEGLIRKKIIGLVGMGCKTLLSSDDMTPICRRIILRASFIAGADTAVSVGVEHLLMSLLREECVAVRLLRECLIDIDELKELLEELYCEEICEADCDFVEISPSVAAKRVPTPLLDANAVDLTEKAHKNVLDPVIGREMQEERLISILLRRSKNNPCLVGEAGVGKTAIVESLATRIVSGNVPDELKNKRIMCLELSMVVAGTKYRGEFEEKIKKLLDEVRAAGDIILFIDELHTIVGAGGAEGAIDASNILKPALARGEIRIIGATTNSEFRASIEKDKALERRFQPIDVPEPSKDECISMLLGISKRYEKYHGITIEEGAVRSAVSLSIRYIHDRCLPDKAIDLIDESCACLRMNNGMRRKQVLTESEILSTLQRRTGIPITALGNEEKSRLVNLDSELKKSVIGQDLAINSLCGAVRRARSGVRSGGRPNASFLFIGESGVGKTECAKALARTVFQNDNSFIRLDMSEFSEPHSVSKLIGSPPGYIGYGEGGNLTEQVRKHPYSLLLFDEIEKAHPDVSALLLQLLDEGVLTDAGGRKVKFDNTIVILTANSRTHASEIGFGTPNLPDTVNEALELLAPEIADRVDEVIRFSPLGRASLCEIINTKAELFCKHISGMGINACVSRDFADSVLEICKSKSARAVTRAALRLAEEAVADLLLKNGAVGEMLTICIENNRGIAKIKQNSY